MTDAFASAVTVTVPILALAAGAGAHAVRDRLRRPDDDWEKKFEAHQATHEFDPAWPPSEVLQYFKDVPSVSLLPLDLVPHGVKKAVAPKLAGMEGRGFVKVLLSELRRPCARTLARATTAACGLTSGEVATSTARSRAGLPPLCRAQCLAPDRRDRYSGGSSRWRALLISVASSPVLSNWQLAELWILLSWFESRYRNIPFCPFRTWRRTTALTCRARR
jgi:hypothetical protein